MARYRTTFNPATGEHIQYVVTGLESVRSCVPRYCHHVVCIALAHSYRGHSVCPAMFNFHRQLTSVTRCARTVRSRFHKLVDESHDCIDMPTCSCDIHRGLAIAVKGARVGVVFQQQLHCRRISFAS